MRRNWFHSVVCVWTAAAVASGGCHTQQRSTTAKPTHSPVAKPAPLAPASTARAIVTIDTKAPEEGSLTAKLADVQKVSTDAPITELTATEANALLARLEPLPDVSTHVAPAVRPSSQPPPRAGVVQPIAFVKPGGAQIADKPLTHQPAGVPALAPPQILPIGEIQAESEIRVRFDEPMIPVAAVGQNAAVATITPAIPGSWRWVDTRVAMFTAQPSRLPQATELTVTVAAGITAVSGAKLAEAETGKFSTPPVMIRGIWPTVQLRPDSPILVEFDQAIDALAIAKYLRVEHGKQKLAFTPIALADAKQLWTKNPAIDQGRADFSKHHVILAPKTAWPSGIDGRVVLAKGAPSLEGPRVSAQETAGEFTVAERFVALGLTCDSMSRPQVMGAKCSAWGGLTVHFSNDIDPKTYRSSKVQIEGERLDDHKPSGDSVYLTTPITVGRAYAIPIGDGIVDIYGQPLGGPKRLGFTTTKQIYQPYVSARSGLYVLDPRWEIPQWTVSAQALTTLRIELYQVKASDYFAFEDYEAGKRATPPGKRVYDKTHQVGARWAAKADVDLRPALVQGTGHVIAIATGIPAIAVKKDEFERRTSAWIQVTRLGVTARVDGERVHAWTQDISPAGFGKPIAGATASLLVEGRTDLSPPVTGGADGHAAFELPPRKEVKPTDESPTALLLVHRGSDSTFAAMHGRHEKAVRHESARWYVTDDRFTYKPGEPVYVKGWVRLTHDGIDPDLAAATGEVGYTLTDSRGNRVGSGSAKLTTQGGFDLEVALPPNVNLGQATFTLTAGKHQHRHPIAIEEFRTPAYAVTLNDDVAHSGTKPLVLGEAIEMTAEAKYYAGGGLGGARIKWDASLASATYRPPGWDRYTFTPPRPRSERHGWRSHNATSANATSTLSGASTSGIVYGIAALPDGEPSILTVDATVTDIDRQTLRASSRKIVVHPATLYVGVRLQPDTDDTVQLVVSDIDGNAVPGVPIEVAFEGVLGSELYRDDAEVVDTQRCKATSAAAPVTCAFKRKDWNTAYTAVAKIADARGRKNAAQFFVPWWSRPDDDLAIVADKPSYKPGDVAKLEIRTKIVPASLVVSFARQGVILQKRIEVTTSPAVVELPIEERYLQNVHVLVDRFAQRRRQHDGSKLPLPEHTQATADLAVDVESARLVMRTRSTQPLVEPGAQATFEVEVTRDDKPVAGAEVALIVVDEAILSLSGKSHADPLAPFYRQVGAGTSVTSTLGYVWDEGYHLSYKPGFSRWNLDDPSGSGTGTGYGYGSGRGGMSGRSASSPSVRVGSAAALGLKPRKDFRATAVFSPTLATDANGKVKVTVKMPDSLTRYRIVALATASTRYFGKAESNIVAQRKINARTVAPRFLTQGDAFELPVVVQNLGQSPRTIDVAVRAANLSSVGPAGKRVTVAGGQRAEVRFGFQTKARGKVVIQTVAVSDDFADASEVSLPVWEPATTESFATYGSIDDKPAFERLEVPRDIFADVGGVEAEVSSTQLQSLTDAYWYLYAYPYECAEQRSGRMLATSAMYDILDAFATPGRPTRKELETMRATDAKRLAKDQNHDGGWGYFGAMKSEPFVTMQVLSALVAQKEAGPVVTKATSFVGKEVKTRLTDLADEAKKRDPLIVSSADDAYPISLAATGLSTLAAAGNDVAPQAVRLHQLATKLGRYPVDAKARVLAIIAGQPKHLAVRQKLLADLLSTIHETASAATATAKYTDRERLLLVSENKTTALVLEALLREAPQHALVLKLARGLLDARKRGRWMSTQENVVVLQAMRRFFDIYEKDTPNYTGKLWFGSAAYTEQSFAGRSTARGVAALDWSTLAPGSAHDVTLQKSGTGRMYYRIGITYAPKQTNLPPLDAGFVVRRRYQAVDDPSDVVLQPDGTWKVKLGARVLVTLEAINTTYRHAVALVDPLPAGFEPVNTNLANAERAATDFSSDRWDHTNMRDNRAEAFAMHLREGSHRFSYTARAATPGTFLAAPAKAEEMYSPETFGRSAGTKVVVE